jgi:hypothetical protein
MSDLTWRGTGVPPSAAPRTAAPPQPANLADLLERVLDKGIVIAGDIRINLLDIELLTIKIRLLIASVDRAREMGIDWWEHDPSLSSGARDIVVENRRLRERLGELEADRSRSASENELPRRARAAERPSGAKSSGPSAARRRGAPP